MACRGCILIVDGDAETRQALVDFARAVGCSATAARDGVDGLRQLERGPAPCLVLVDLAMARLSGEEFVRQVRRGPGGGDLTIVSMSADEGRAPPPAVDRHLRKPFRLEELWPTIERSCRATIWLEADASLAVS